MLARRPRRYFHRQRHALLLRGTPERVRPRAHPRSCRREHASWRGSAHSRIPVRLRASSAARLRSSRDVHRAGGVRSRRTHAADRHLRRFARTAPRPNPSPAGRTPDQRQGKNRCAAGPRAATERSRRHPRSERRRPAPGTVRRAPDRGEPRHSARLAHRDLDRRESVRRPGGPAQVQEAPRVPRNPSGRESPNSGGRDTLRRHSDS